MSVASNIIESLVTELGTIKKSSSYSIDVKKVERFEIPVGGEQEVQPLISVLAGEDQIIIQDGTNVRRNFDIELFVYLASYTDLQEKLQELLDDIHVLVYAPIDLGTNCLSVEIINTTEPFSSDELKDAGAIINIRVVYYASLAAF